MSNFLNEVDAETEIYGSKYKPSKMFSEVALNTQCALMRFLKTL